MQFEISHAQQTRAAGDVDSFRVTQGSIFATLDSQLLSDMAKSAGSYNTAFTKVRIDVADVQRQIGVQLNIMNEKMLQATKDYQVADTTSTDYTTGTLNQVGSSSFGTIGIFSS